MTVDQAAFGVAGFEEVMEECSGDYARGREYKELVIAVLESRLEAIEQAEQGEFSLAVPFAEKDAREGKQMIDENKVRESLIASKQAVVELLEKVRDVRGSEVNFLLRDCMQSTSVWRFDEELVKDLVKLSIEAGFEVLEIGGGQSFQKAIENGHNPFKILRAANEAAMGPDGKKKIKLQILLRGANLLGFRHYGEDVQRDLVFNLLDCGVDVIRNFDALNDPRNLEATIKFVNEWNELHKDEEPRHIQGAMSFCRYPFNNEDNEDTQQYGITYWLNYARKLAEMGVGSIAIKDMSGQLTPELAEKLIPQLKDLRNDKGERYDLPVVLHIHSTNGEQSLATARRAFELGIDVVEFGVGSLAGGAAHHDVRDAMDEEHIRTVRLEGLADLEKMMAENFPAEERQDTLIPADVLRRFSALGVPGGAIPFVLADLKKYTVGKLRGEIEVRNRTKPEGQKEAVPSEEVLLDQALGLFEAELPQTCADAWNCGLVTPSADMVCKQAVNNITYGRYKNFNRDFARLMLGEYGEVINHATGKLVPLSDEGRQVQQKALAFLRKNETTWATQENREERTYEVCDQHPTETTEDELEEHQATVERFETIRGDVASEYADTRDLVLIYAVRPKGQINKAWEAVLSNEQADLAKLLTAFEAAEKDGAIRNDFLQFQRLWDEKLSVRLKEVIRFDFGDLLEGLRGWALENFSGESAVFSTEALKMRLDDLTQENLDEHSRVIFQEGVLDLGRICGWLKLEIAGFRRDLEDTSAEDADFLRRLIATYELELGELESISANKEKNLVKALARVRFLFARSRAVKKRFASCQKQGIPLSQVPEKLQPLSFENGGDREKFEQTIDQMQVMARAYFETLFYQFIQEEAQERKKKNDLMIGGGKV